VDGRGNIYFNGADFDFVAGAPAKPGYIKLVTPDGQLHQAAGDIQSPNGMVITPDNRTLIISESFAGRLTASISTPTEGCPAGGSSPKDSARTASASTPKARSGSAPPGSQWPASAPAGEVLQRVELPGNRPPFALMLGGPDRIWLISRDGHDLCSDSVGKGDLAVTQPRGTVLTDCRAAPNLAEGSPWPS
jgi:sugar lactone lactonase YvrE